MIMSSFSPIEVSSIITMLPGGRDAGGTRNDGRGEQTAVRHPAGDRPEDPAAAGRRAARPVGASDPTPRAADSAGRPSRHWTSAAGGPLPSAPSRAAAAARPGALRGALCGLRPDAGLREAGAAAPDSARAGDIAPVAGGRRTLDRPAAGGAAPPVARTEGWLRRDGPSRRVAS